MRLLKFSDRRWSGLRLGAKITNNFSAAGKQKAVTRVGGKKLLLLPRLVFSINSTDKSSNDWCQISLSLVKLSRTEKFIKQRMPFDGFVCES